MSLRKLVEKPDIFNNVSLPFELCCGGGLMSACSTAVFGPCFYTSVDLS